MLEDEAELARRLGVNIETYPKDVTFSKTTGRFSINWVAHSYRKDDLLRWGLLAPPNDERKRKKLDDWLAKYPDDVERMKKRLEEEGFELEN